MIEQTKVYVKRVFECSVDELFKWITEPGLMCKWFGPKHLVTHKVESDFQVGGTYCIELIKPNGDQFYIKGQYLEIDQPHKLVFSFRYSGISALSSESQVSITLKEVQPKQVELTLVQDFQTLPKDMNNKSKNWEYMLDNLKKEI